MHKDRRIYKTLTGILSVLYSGTLIYAVFFARRRRYINIRMVNFIPVKNTLNDFRSIHELGMFNFFSNTLGNVFLFIPLSFILMAFLKIYKLSLIILLGFLLSFTIELLQYIFKDGVADIDDSILNTLGTIIGFFCCRAFSKFIQSRQPLVV